MQLYARILKVDEAKRTVIGRAAQEMVDHAGEMLDYEASKPYFKAWSEQVSKDTGGKSLGNVRAMHQPIAAGKVIGIDFNDAEKAIDIETKIVDNDEWRKVLEGVYAGFSIGGKYVEGTRKVEKVNGQDVTRYAADPNEVSLVDRPCIPSAKFFDVIKADGTLAKVDLKTPEPPQPEPEEVTVNGTAEEVDALVKLMATKGMSMGQLLEGLAKGFPPAKEEEETEDELGEDGKPTGKKVPKKKKEAEAEKIAPAVLRKNFYDCASFSQVLTSLIALQKSAQFEAFLEGDASPIAGKIASAVALVGEVFKAAIDEAIAESKSGTEAPAAYVTLAEQAGELAKLKPAEAKPSEPVLAADAVAKLEATRRDELSKLVADAMAPLQKQLGDAQAEIKVLKAQPAPATIRLRAVSKSQDVPIDNQADPDAALKKLAAPIKDSSGEMHSAAGLIKAVHALGARPMTMPF